MAFHSFEDRFLGKLDKNISLGREQEQLEKADKRAQEVFKRDEINPLDFSDLYDPNMIKRDLETLAKKEQLFSQDSSPEKQRSKKYADVLEAIIHEQITESNWLGEGARTTKTSRFDDVVNGVDEIVEFEGKDKTVTSRLALAVDVTFSGQLKKKFERIRNEIHSGNLAKVKYFSSDLSHQRGELTQLPRVVIGAEIGNVKKMQDVWSKNEDGSFERHQFQMLMLEEMYVQLNAFSKYASKIGKEEIAAIYKQAANIVNRIMREKIREDGLSAGIWEDDKVFHAIKQELVKLEK